MHQISAAFIQKPERKSTKCHDFSDLNLNDLEMAFRSMEKMSNNYFT